MKNKKYPNESEASRDVRLWKRRVWQKKNIEDNKQIWLERWKKQREDRKEEIAEYKKRYWKEQISNTEKGLCIRMRKESKNRARETGLDHNITTQYLLELWEKSGKTCPVFKVKFIIDSTKKDRRYKPSLDRIDNEKGYIKGNVMFISWKANTMKSNANAKELIKFSKWVDANFTERGYNDDDNDSNNTIH